MTLNLKYNIKSSDIMPRKKEIIFGIVFIIEGLLILLFTQPPNSSFCIIGFIAGALTIFIPPTRDFGHLRRRIIAVISITIIGIMIMIMAYTFFLDDPEIFQLVIIAQCYYWTLASAEFLNVIEEWKSSKKN